MARFRYSLERLLALRRTEEDVARAAVAEATAVVLQRTAGLEDAARRVGQAQGALRNLPGTLLPAEELDWAALYLKRTGRARAEAEAALEGARQARLEKAAVARAAWQAREMLDNLRMRRFAAFQKEEEKAAQGAVDDLTASRWERRSRW